MALDRSAYAFLPSALAVHMLSRLAVLQTKVGFEVTEGAGGAEAFGTVGECTMEAEILVALNVEEEALENLKLDEWAVVFVASETGARSVRESLGYLQRLMPVVS